MLLHTPLGKGLFLLAAVAGVSLCAAGCGDSVAEDGDTEGADGKITNECGTYDPDNDMHGLGPIDPTEEGLVEACDALCGRMTTVEGCSTELTACRDDCRLSACGACPGSIDDLALCKTKYFDAADCMCVDGVVECALPAECEEQQFATGACGG